MMRIRGVLLVAAVSVLVGCPGPVNPCSASSCPEGTTCDAETGACVLDCDTACGVDEFCSNRECRPRYQSLSILHPAENGAVGVTARVVAQLALTPGAPRSDPSTLAVEARGAEDAGVGSGELTLVDAGWYEGSLALSSSHGDVIALRAAYDAWGLSSQRVYAVVDEQPPAFFLSWTPPERNPGEVGVRADERDAVLPGAFKRDEQIRIRVESAADPIDAQSVVLRYAGVSDAGTAGEWTTVAVQEVPEGTGCTQAYCGEAVVDAWTPQFDLVRGTLPVVVEGTDVAGNLGSADAGVPVTRVRWVFDYGSPFHFRAAPSVGSSGTVYAAASESLNGVTGLVAAVSPEGEGLWTNEVGGVLASMPVGEMDGGDRLFVGANTGSGASAFVRLRGSDGGVSSSSTMVGTYEASFALATMQADGDTGPVETLYAVLNNLGSSEAQVFRPEGQTGSKADAVALPQAVSYPGNVTTSGNQAHFVDSQGDFRSYELNAAADNMTQRFANPIGLFVTGGALSGAEYAGGGGGGPGVRASLGVRITDGGTVWRSPNLVAQPSSVVVAENGQVFAGTASGLARFTPAAPSAAVVEVTGADNVFAAPVLVGGERLYAATMNGKIGLWDRDLNPIWLGSVGAAFEASPNMDCARDAGVVVPGRPPTLYLLDKGGKLYSIVSDEALDTSAQWPRYQRDPKNRGSTTYDLGEFTCP